MSEKKKPDALESIVNAMKEKKDKREAVKSNAKEKGKAKALTDKEKIAVIWEYLGLDE